MMRNSLFAGLAAALIFAAGPTFAETILFTDFDGRIATDETDGTTTVSNILWVTNGVQDPGDIISDFPLFGGNAATDDRFAVDRNIANEGPWDIDIAINVLSSPIILDSLAFDVFNFTNSGVPQQGLRDVLVNLMLGDDVVVDDSFLVDATNNTGPFPVLFDLSGVTLAANTNYTLNLDFSAPGGFGNNTGFDNLLLSGATAVPVPAGLPLILTGLAVFALFRRKARAA